MKKKVAGVIFVLMAVMRIPEVLAEIETLMRELRWAQYGLYDGVEESAVVVVLSLAVMLVMGIAGVKLIRSGNREARGSSAVPNRPNRTKTSETNRSAAQTVNPFEIVENNKKRRFGGKLWSDKERRAESQLSFVEQERIRERKSMIEQGIYRRETDANRGSHWEDAYFRDESSYDDCAAAYSGVEEQEYHRHDR